MVESGEREMPVGERSDARAAEPGAGWWYIECRPGRVGASRVRRWLADQGIRRVEGVTDRVLRCWAAAAPRVPDDWGLVVARGAEPPAAESAEASAPAVQPGEIVRVRRGPAAGFAGRVQRVLDAAAPRVVVEVLVWGKGMAIELPVADVERLARLPWERTSPRS
jgi:transcription antitermination factor NusG